MEYSFIFTNLNWLLKIHSEHPKWPIGDIVHIWPSHHQSRISIEEWHQFINHVLTCCKHRSINQSINQSITLLSSIVRYPSWPRRLARMKCFENIIVNWCWTVSSKTPIASVTMRTMQEGWGSLHVLLMNLFDDVQHRFKYEMGGHLSDLSTPPTVLQSVHQLLEVC